MANRRERRAMVKLSKKYNGPGIEGMLTAIKQSAYYQSKVEAFKKADTENKKNIFKELSDKESALLKAIAGFEVIHGQYAFYEKHVPNNKLHRVG